MKLHNIPFSPPDMSEEEVNEVRDTILSGWITTGPRVKEFERQIASYVGVNRAVCLNSQTSCAEMVLRLLGIGPGDEVIVPAYTYTATASIVCHVGAKIVFVDVQSDCLQMDYDALENAITKRTKVIIPVDIAGIPCDYARLFDIVNRKRHLFSPTTDLQRAIGRIIIAADCAHAFGAEWHAQKVGNIADFSSFSFHAVKNLTTAEGGALTWRSIPGIEDDQIYHQIQLYSLHGQSKDAFSKTQLGAWEYDVIGPWYKCNMTDITAALGLVQLRRYPALLARRREIIERYNAAFLPLRLNVLNHYTADYSSSGHLYITRVPQADLQRRQEIIVKMAEHGIATNVHYKPLPMMTAYRQMGFDIRQFPNAYAQFVNEITLPLYTRLSDEDIEYIIYHYSAILQDKE